ncbi:hypothetical protein [Streptomyces sparsogenes]|uniref:Uncharacterized protein n=1 Tax=Streptomyces sparsogenes DSM 40356 TaxID=1331668 RepID=A0A1R1SB59_9ACTN|nr:hypothetical protein [Streptomyces sparsogenes]OMI35523.1 hypothetical protein SPAR_30811 [Streptomyces sparsogenes DSM 40356]
MRSWGNSLRSSAEEKPQWRDPTAFDTGPPSSPLLTGYTRLSPEDLCTADRGSGWVGDRPNTPDRAFVWFSLALDGGADGRAADLEITGSKLNGLWRIAALVV